MFQAPKAGGSAAPAEAIDADQPFLLKLVDLKDEGPGQFSKGPDDHRICWTFEMAYAATKAPVRDIDGGMYKFLDWTSSATTKSANKTATARKWLEALFGRDLEDSEIPGNLAQEAIGKVARAMLEEKPAKDVGSFPRLSILKLAPYVKGSPTPPASPKTAATDDALPF